MTLDIIIPAYNEYHNLKHLLPYLLENTDPLLTNIFVIDAKASTDNSADLCKSLPVNYIKSSSTQRSMQLNEGASFNAGDVLFFLHADVIPPTNFYSLIKSHIALGFEAGCFSYKFNSQRLILKLNSFFTRFKGVFTGGGDQGLYISRKRF